MIKFLFQFFCLVFAFIDFIYYNPSSSRESPTVHGLTTKHTILEVHLEASEVDRKLILLWLTTDLFVNKPHFEQEVLTDYHHTGGYQSANFNL